MFFGGKSPFIGKIKSNVYCFYGYVLNATPGAPVDVLVDVLLSHVVRPHDAHGLVSALVLYDGAGLGGSDARGAEWCLHEQHFFVRRVDKRRKRRAPVTLGKSDVFMCKVSERPQFPTGIAAVHLAKGSDACRVVKCKHGRVVQLSV